MKSRKKNKLSFLLALTDTVRVFNRVLKGMNLQFMSMLEKMSTIRQTHNTVNGKILVISISRRDTNGSDLM